MENDLTFHIAFGIMYAFQTRTRRSAVGSALRSGANHRLRFCEFRKSLNALKNLTISSVQLNEKIPKWVVWPHVWPLTKKAKSRRSAVGSALRSGRKGRGFESRRLDQKLQEIQAISCIFYLFFNSPFFVYCVSKFRGDGWFFRHPLSFIIIPINWNLSLCYSLWKWHFLYIISYCPFIATWIDFY